MNLVAVGNRANPVSVQCIDCFQFVWSTDALADTHGTPFKDYYCQRCAELKQGGKVMTLTPAYGRDYKSAREVTEAFDNNQDFIVADPFSRWGGKPVNKEQIDKGTRVSIRYQRLRKQISVRVQ